MCIRDSWFTPTILACAAVAWAITGEMSRGITVLIVGCPCALILAAPTAVVAAIGRAARAGVLVKGGQHLEELARAKVALFDKTGTLTEGKPRVERVLPMEGVEADFVLARAASVEQDSTHPLARAVLKAARYAQVTIHRAEHVFTQIGLGVRAWVEGAQVEVGSAYLGGGTLSLPVPLRDQIEAIKERGATPLVVYQDKRPLGILSVADHVRPGAATTVEQLYSLGLNRVGVLSGDHEKATQLVAKATGLTDAWAGLKPEEKLEVLSQFQTSGHEVLFVGDGINDAPALAMANVSVAMGAAGTHVALEAADIALMHDDISTIPFLIRLSRRMLAIIKWNVAFGLVFNGLAVLASGSGLLTPIMGAVVHNIGSVLVVCLAASLAFLRE